MACLSISSIMPASALSELAGPLAIVCHDAGAANLILAWLAAEPRRDVVPVMEGPAAQLWREQFPDVPIEVSLEQAIKKARALLTGSGWASEIEHRARARARDAKIESVAVVDHWVNYSERFQRGGEVVLPDAIWVADAWAKARAETAFPALPIFQRPNLYLEGEVARISPLAPEAPDQILYLLEPTRSCWGGREPGEFQALDYLLDNLGALGLSSATPVRLRLHPAEARGKYSNWLERHRGYDLAIDGHGSLAEAVGASSWVAGLNTAALAVALAAGRRTVCALPPWAPPCVLPHDGLIHLKALAKR